MSAPCASLTRAASNERQTVQAVDNRTFKEAPPQPEPPNPPPGPMPPVNNADDVKRALDPLQNGGKRGPNGVGTNPDVKEVWDQNSMRQLWDYLTRNATDSQGPPGYNGPDGRCPTGPRLVCDRAPRGGVTRFKLGIPMARTRKSILRTRHTFHQSVRRRSFRRWVTRGRPHRAAADRSCASGLTTEWNFRSQWLASVVAEPLHARVSHSRPAADDHARRRAARYKPAPVTAPADPGFLPDLGHDLAEAGKTAGAGVLAGVAIIVVVPSAGG